MNSADSNISVKRIHIPSSVMPTEQTPEYSQKTSLPKKRVITTTKQWNFQPEEFTHEYQRMVLAKLYETATADHEDEDDVRLRNQITLLKRHIHLKWYGYRAQDIEKNLYRSDLLISEPEIVELLIHSQLLCFYCRSQIQLFYENVRESSQWSIERIDNSQGHNRENVVISCLKCNLHRKTMYYERFRATKQLRITKTA
jgi:hypothetical protein